MTPTDIAIDVLATIRATRLITQDEITAPLRSRTFQAFPLARHPHGPSYVITCPYCSSVYIAAAITLTHTKPFRFARPLVYALAIAAPTAILAEKSEAAASPTGWS